MSKSHDAKSQNKKAKSLQETEKELAQFAATVNGQLKPYFVSRTLQRLLTEPEPKDGKIDNSLDLLPGFMSYVIVAFVWILVHGNFSAPYTGWAGLGLGVVAAYAWEWKLRPKLFFSDCQFRLMRLDYKVSGDEWGEFPLRYISAYKSDEPSGFGWEFWRSSRVNVGDLVVAVSKGQMNGAAIIHLSGKGKLSVSSWKRDLYEANILPPLSEDIKKLALEFDEKCNTFKKYWAQREEMRAIAARNEKKAQRNLDAIWSGVSLKPELRNKLIALADHFADGSPAASRGLLLYGPPGTGKTLIAKKLAATMDCAFYPLSLPDLKAGYTGQSGQKVKEIWATALAQERAVIFIDECEGVFGRRGSVNTDSFSEEIVQAFLAEWDGFHKQKTVWVVGATNRRDLLDPAIISRFGEEVEIGLPDAAQRVEILAQQLREMEVNSSLPNRAAELTQGLSGRELETLAGRIAREGGGKPLTNEMLERFTASMRKQGSSATDAGAVWANLVLPEPTLKSLQAISGMLQHAETFAKRGVSVPRGVLLYGPPGTGKTQIGRTLANETGLRFIAASTADLKAGYIGQSGQKVRELFERARESSPCILFIDELDIVAPARGFGSGNDAFTQEIVGQLLQEMDGAKATKQDVFVLAATNRTDQVDPAVLSRFTRSIEIPLPDREGRERLFKVMLKGKPIGFNLDEGSKVLAGKTSGMSGRDIRNLIEQAEQVAVGRAIEHGTPHRVKIYMKDFPI